MTDLIKAFLKESRVKGPVAPCGCRAAPCRGVGQSPTRHPAAFAFA